MHQRLLVHITALPGIRAPGGKVILTQKFLEGTLRYSELWGGPMRVVMREQTELTNSLDNVEVEPKELPYELTLVPRGSGLLDACSGGGVVMAGLIHGETSLAKPLSERKIPVVYGSELTLKTRCQILLTSASNPAVALRRMLWEANQELKNVAAVKLSAGLQSNGTPTFEAYQGKSPNPLLFFDSRTKTSMLAEAAHLEARFLTRRTTKTLRLAFSGRLIRIKGADQLLDVALSLRRRKVPFTLDLYGGGECEPELRRRIVEHGLQEVCRLRGTLNFETELTPQIRDECDLFVCCHRQGDPSCTYLETLSLGVPVVGYDNEALAGLMRRVNAGRVTKMGDPEKLADAIEAVALDAPTLERWSQNALKFASEHTFERTFERRMRHVREVAGC